LRLLESRKSRRLALLRARSDSSRFNALATTSSREAKDSGNQLNCHLAKESQREIGFATLLAFPTARTSSKSGKLHQEQEAIKR